MSSKARLFISTLGPIASHSLFLSCIIHPSLSSRWFSLTCTSAHISHLQNPLSLSHILPSSYWSIPLYLFKKKNHLCIMCLQLEKAGTCLEQLWVLQPRADKQRRALSRVQGTDIKALYKYFDRRQLCYSKEGPDLPSQRASAESLSLLWSWSSYLTSLSLSFLICQMEIVVALS